MTSFFAYFILKSFEVSIKLCHSFKGGDKIGYISYNRK